MKSNHTVASVLEKKTRKNDTSTALVLYLLNSEVQHGHTIYKLHNQGLAERFYLL